ncbi:MAG: hypothetical protein MJ211_09760 [Bacteroidales bacterium]|nr:hypothetical protein [Bacteroidales bacterium]
MNTTYYTLNDLFKILQGGVIEPEKEDVPTKTSNVGSIYNEDALEQALRTNTDEIAELQRQIEAKNRYAETVRNKLAQMKTQTKLVRNGTDVAITMSRDEAIKLVENLSNHLSTSSADRLTFTLKNVG